MFIVDKEGYQVGSVLSIWNKESMLIVPGFESGFKDNRLIGYKAVVENIIKGDWYIQDPSEEFIRGLRNKAREYKALAENFESVYNIYK